MSQSTFLKYGYFVVSLIVNFLSLSVHTQAYTYIFYKPPAAMLQLHPFIVTVQHNQSKDKPQVWSVWMKKKKGKTNYRRFFSILIPDQLCSFENKSPLHVWCQLNDPSPTSHPKVGQAHWNGPRMPLKATFPFLFVCFPFLLVFFFFEKGDSASLNAILGTWPGIF